MTSQLSTRPNIARVSKGSSAIDTRDGLIKQSIVIAVAVAHVTVTSIILTLNGHITTDCHVRAKMGPAYLLYYRLLNFSVWNFLSVFRYDLRF